ncbi:hypothetical protein H6G33_37460 [Calothrix sp. FACHB-1219]|uniref:hypothetical protein n=1 Tax=unclassified Calothrix TaxID=2619626 RepID=UPI0016862F38|nr:MULTISPECIES: hypothetical protein [unclassified Calothrix]MBD2208079.1 hypothetical protein [Calothrix sp. FACHB-168]MBD2222617.1 hypothetical protein [Calothrix sp. FACHB-1219]
MTFADVRKGEIISGYKCTGHTKCGQWAKFAIDNSEEWTREQQDEWERLKEQRRREQEQAEAKRKQESLSLQERDKQYRELIETLTLSPEDKTDLKQRGFSDLEIELCGIKSVERYQHLQQQFSHLLPGVSQDGKTLMTNAGYLLPVRNVDGLIVACQVRLRGILTEGRYRWLSSKTKDNPDGQSPHIHGKDFSELPLAVHRPQLQPQGIGLVEGTGVKPFKASLGLSLIVIGAAGGQWTSSPNLLQKYLTQISHEVGGDKHIKLFPDAGDVQNKAVVERWRKTCNLLTDLGYLPVIGWWGQVSKEDNDIDELENFDDIQHISPKEFFEICEQELSRGQGFGQQESKSYVTKVRKSPDWLNWIDKNKFTPDVVLNCNGDLVLPDELMDIENKNLLINSGLGTNKTGEGLRLIKSLESVYNPFTGYTGVCTTILGYINSLLHQTIERAGGYGIDILHVQSDDDGKLFAKDTNSHIAGCIHSLPHFDGHFSGKAVMVDEIESVLTTLVTGSNLGSKHGEIIEMFSRAISASYGNIFLDGNMTDISADLIEEITGKKNIKVLNPGQIRRKNFRFIISAKKGKNGKVKLAVNDPSPLIKMILDTIRKGQKAFVTTDSRIFGEGLAENAINITADERSVKQLADVADKEGYKVFVISKNTSGTDEGKAFLSNPGEYIAKNNISLVIGTPSIGSGVSIQLPEGFEDHFGAQFTLFCGVLSTKQQKQLLARLRNNKLIHYIYCPVKSLVKDRNRPQQYSATEYLKEINELQRLNRAISHEQIQQLFDDAKSRINPVFDRYSAELGALDNFEQDNLLECLSYSLESEGHGVECVYLDPDEQAKNEMKEAKERIRSREAVEFQKSIPFDSTLEADNQVKANPTPENHLRRDKTYFVKERLPGIENKEVWGVEFIREFVIDDSPQYKVKAITREWLLRHHKIAFENHNIRTIRKLEKRYVTSKELLPGDYGKLWALKELKFEERVLNAERFTCKSPNIQQLDKEYRERKDLQKLLGIEPPRDKVKNTIIQDLIRPMLEFLGKKTEEQGRIRIDGISRTSYKAVSAIDEKSRTAIYECLTNKFTKEYEKRELDKMLESLRTQQELAEQIKSQQSTDAEITTEVKSELDKSAEGNAAIIDEWLGTLSWEELHTLSSNWSSELKAKTWKLLTPEQQRALKQLLPQTIEGKWVAYLLDAEKSGTLDNTIRQFLALDDNQIAEAWDMLPERLKNRCWELHSTSA